MLISAACHSASAATWAASAALTSAASALVRASSSCFSSPCACGISLPSCFCSARLASKSPIAAGGRRRRRAPGPRRRRTARAWPGRHARGRGRLGGLGGRSWGKAIRRRARVAHPRCRERPRAAPPPAYWARPPPPKGSVCSTDLASSPWAGRCCASRSSRCIAVLVTHDWGPADAASTTGATRWRRGRSTSRWLHHAAQADRDRRSRTVGMTVLTDRARRGDAVPPATGGRRSSPSCVMVRPRW